MQYIGEIKDERIMYRVPMSDGNDGKKWSEPLPMIPELYTVMTTNKEEKKNVEIDAVGNIPIDIKVKDKTYKDCWSISVQEPESLSDDLIISFRARNIKKD